MKFKRALAVLPLLLAGLYPIFFSGCPRPPLVPEKPRGPAVGYKNVVLACTTSTTDPAGGRVAFQFDWGDNTRSEWSDWVDGGVAYADTHTYTTSGTMAVMARAKNTRGKISGWSEPLEIEITPGEGGVRWRFGFHDPESPEDSADFTGHAFSIGPDGQIYIPAGEIPALMCRNNRGMRRWEFIEPDYDEFGFAAAIGDDGTIYIGTEGGNFYALNPNGTVKAVIRFYSGVMAPPAIGADGTIYIQTENDTVFALDPQNLTRKWFFYAGGGTQPPVVGGDGVVFISQDDTIFALDPGNGQPKWRYGMRQSVVTAPAVDLSRNVIYVGDDDGWLVAVDINDGTRKWETWVGGEISSPVIGADGTVYLTASGALAAINPENGNEFWRFVPPLNGDASPPAVSAEGNVYFLVVGGEQDTLYAVNSDGSRRWATGLGAGITGDFISAPKIDAEGYVYVGDGTLAFCIVGKGGPAPSSWPMYGGDIRNSGRAR